MATVEQRQRLLEAVSKAEQSYEFAKQAAARQGRVAAVRHKCFVSYHVADIAGVTDFVERFNEVFIPRVVGVSDSDHFEDPVNSQDEDYIKAQIGARYLSDSTVTILYVGACTWSRKYVDWELASSLRNDRVNKRNGLMAITPADRSVHPLPDRFADNWAADDSRYARYHFHPRSAADLRTWIEDAFLARTSRAELIAPARALRSVNSRCP